MLERARMRNSRSILVAVTASVLIAASTSVMLARTPGEPPAPISWKVTLLHDGLPVQSITIDRDVPGDPKDLFSRDHGFVGSRSYLLEPVSITGSNSRDWFAVDRLRPAERKIVEFLLLLPPATLLVCLFRNVVGLNSFGTFAPALLGLAFREVQSIIGVGVVLAILLLGWLFRRGLSRFHLLQAPRSALLLSLIVVMLLFFIFACSSSERTGPSAVSLFPLVILTGMIERFWSIEEEDGTSASFRILVATLAIAACVWLLTTAPVVCRWMLRRPETIGLIMAGQLLLGRYIGFRILEVRRFRALSPIRGGR
jgi:hypothetical protein